VLRIAGAQDAPAVAHLPRIVWVTTSPALYPAYSPEVHDYVVWCNPSTPVHITA
jgi:hypothetical protein